METDIIYMMMVIHYFPWHRFIPGSRSILIMAAAELPLTLAMVANMEILPIYLSRLILDSMVKDTIL